MATTTTKESPQSSDSPRSAQKSTGAVLYEAAKRGDPKRVAKLLRGAAKGDEAVDWHQNRFGRSPLYAAASRGHRDVIETLLKAGADVDHADSAGETPLYAAAFGGHTKVVEALLHALADPQKADTRGQTPLFVACRGGHKEIAEMLLQAGADPNTANAAGWTPLFAAAFHGHKDVVELLLKRGADVNKATVPDAWTPLFIARRNGHTAVAAVLLRAGGIIDVGSGISAFIPTDPEPSLRTGKTPVSKQKRHKQHASFDGGGGGAAGDASDPSPGSSPPASSHTAGKRPADESTRCKSLTSPIAPAAGRSAVTLPTAFSPPPPSQQQSHSVSLSPLPSLSQLQSSATASDFDGLRLLQAADNGNVELVCRLLKEGSATPNFSENEFAWTPLYAAARRGFKPVVQALLDSGANTNQCTKDGLSPLYIAAAKGHTEVADALIAGGADVNKANKNGWTPLFVAAFNGRKDAVELLLKHGADPNSPNACCWTPLLAAISAEHMDVAEALAQAGARIPEKLVPRAEAKIGKEALATLLAAKQSQSQPGPPSPPKAITSQTSVEFVFDFFVARGLPEVAAVFKDNGIDGEVLLTISKEDLEKLSITTPELQAQILSVINTT